MAKDTMTTLERRALIAIAEYAVSLTKLRNAMSEGMGFNVTDMECLRLLFLRGVATPSELARYTGLTSGATTAMLDRLERAGMIERRPNPEDRRGTLIAPVKAGAERVAAWFESARKAQTELIASYPEKDLKLITDFFERITEVLTKEREKIQRSG